MLMRFDPFSDFDRLSRQTGWGGQRSSFMSADAYRRDERFYLHIDLPGVDEWLIALYVDDIAKVIAQLLQSFRAAIG